VFLTEAALRNRTTVFVLVLLIVFMGAGSYLTLPREAAPEVPIPYVLVTTAYEGVSPEDIESSVTMKIEKELAGLKGVKEITSTSAEGMSLIVIEFQPDVIIEDALQYVRDRVDLAKGDLPDGADEPVIKEINVAEFPIMMISISGGVSEVRLKAIADELEDAIEKIPGVLEVETHGALEREIRVEVDPDRLASYGLTLPELLALIPSENVNVSAGGLETEGTQFYVRVPAEFVDPAEVDTLLLTVRNGRPIYLTDVATVRDTFKDRLSFSRLDGAGSVTISVKKRVGENILRIADAVKQVLRQAQRTAPMGVKFEITFDMSKNIRRIVSDLENNILTALILVVAVLFLFLGWRTSLIVALVIPLSMLMSFAAIQALGYTLNVVVLFSLVLALGMLVDNAIVVVENIYRHMQLGCRSLEAASKGTAEVAWPVITSTATTVAAFLPLVFWPGIMGKFMRYLPIVLMITLSSSLFVALVVNPTASSVFARAEPRPRDRIHWFVRGYRAFLATALAHRFTTLSLAGLLLVGLGLLYVMYGRSMILFPDIDPDRAVINVRAPQGTHVRETDRLARIVEERVAPFSDRLEHLVTNVGAAGAGVISFGGVSAGPHVANLTLVFPEYARRKRPSADTVAEVRARLADLAGAEIKVEKVKHGPPTGAPVEVRIIGRDFDELARLSERAKAMISSVPGLVNLRSDLEATRPELIFRVDRRRAMLLGLNSRTIGNFLKTAIFGRAVSTYREYNDEYDITVRLPVSQRTDIQDLLRLRVPNAAGRAVPLSSLGRFEYAGGLGTITRVNEKRVVTLTADAEGRLSSDVLRDVRERLAKLPLPPGYEIRYAGERETQEEVVAFLKRAFLVAVLLIVLILVTQFNSLAVPFIIMTTVVLSLIGVLVGLLATHMPFIVVMTGVGIISLAGVVVNNAIVLLAYTRQLQERGLNLLDAVVQAGMTRLRPVLLTAATTILGLMPMALGVGFDFHKLEFIARAESSQWWRGMAVAVIFGLTFATVLTLVVVPTLYTSLYLLAQRLGMVGNRRAGSA